MLELADQIRAQVLLKHLAQLKLWYPVHQLAEQIHLVE
jgi:hypothetical protein